METDLLLHAPGQQTHNVSLSEGFTFFFFNRILYTYLSLKKVSPCCHFSAELHPAGTAAPERRMCWTKLLSWKLKATFFPSLQRIRVPPYAVVQQLESQCVAISKINHKASKLQRGTQTCDCPALMHIISL